MPGSIFCLGDLLNYWLARISWCDHDAEAHSLEMVPSKLLIHSHPMVLSNILIHSHIMVLSRRMVHSGIVVLIADRG
jgi:hypothetical protein